MIKHLPTQITGLKYEPRFINPDYDHRDSLCEYDHYVERCEPERKLYHGGPGLLSFSKQNQEVLRNLLRCYQPYINSILEIGVSRDGYEESSTKILLENRNSECTYIGVDLRDLANEFHKPNNKQFFLQENSLNRQRIYSYLDAIQIKTIDLLFIDGDHSIATCINDWQFIERLSDNGFIVMHDTSHHPGPREIFEAVDEKIFHKQKYCLDDFGISIFRKIHV
jgi:predicted O-methyltransferase YrrM